MSRVVDADGHILEPADTWERYIDPAFRDRAIRIAPDDEGFERLWIDNQPMRLLRGNLGTLGGIDLDSGMLGSLTEDYSYAAGSPPGSYDPAARLKVLERRRHRRRHPLPHHRHLLGRQRGGPRPRHRLHPRLQSLDRRFREPRSQTPASGGAHLADRPGRCRGGSRARPQGRLRWHLSLARRPGAQRPPASRSGVRPLLGRSPRPRHAGRLPRRGARAQRLPPHAGTQRRLGAVFSSPSLPST